MAAGEDVRILPRHTWPSHLWLPDRDFWLFGDREAVVMIYDEDGNFLGAETTSDPTEVERYRQAQDHLLEDSVPLGDYLASLGIKETA